MNERVEVVMGEMPFWPVQAITCAVIATVLFLLGRYLYRGPRRRGTSGGRDAFMLVSGLLVLALVVAVARQGGGFEWGRALAGVAAVLGGVVLHRRTRRRA
jgi:hypothetical protein